MASGGAGAPATAYVLDAGTGTAAIGDIGGYWQLKAPYVVWDGSTGWNRGADSLPILAVLRP
jgi:hypothetical protein